MTKHDLISEITTSTGIAYEEVALIVEAFFSSVKDAVALGEAIAFREFGSFSSKVRPEKLGRNIKKNTFVHIPQQRVVVFKAASDFVENVRESHRLVDLAENT